MRVVPPEHVTGVYRCAITQKRTDPDGFVATGQILNGWDQEVNISIAAAKEIARLIGWYPPAKVENLEARIESHAIKLQEVTDQLEQLEQIQKLVKELNN